MLLVLMYYVKAKEVGQIFINGPFQLMYCFVHFVLYTDISISVYEYVLSPSQVIPHNSIA
jgi:hypothetical protein